MLRGSPQKREEKERVRHALLRAALQLGAHHGFASLGLREVSRAASIAPTSFYRHFTDMSELGLALVQELVRPMLRGLSERLTDGDATPGDLVEGIFVAVREDAELVRFLVAERAGAFEGLRGALSRELDELAVALLAIGKTGPEGASKARSRAISDAGIALVLEGFARVLELPPEEREGARERLVESLTLVLERGSTRGGENA